MARRRMISNQLAAWQKVGDTLTGKLVEKGQQTINGNDCGRYVLQAEDGNYIVNGTRQIDESMTHAEIGDMVEIEYQGVAKTSNGWEVSRFAVYVLDEE